MLFINCFAEGGALLETEPQGDVSISVDLPEYEEILMALIVTPETSAALARLFLAGAAAQARGLPAWPGEEIVP